VKLREKREKRLEAKRTRRDPEAARQLILAAAATVFSHQSPDIVGLKDVAREAGVSHALVTHYFGTYDALVDAVLERRIADVRERAITGLKTLGPGESPTSLIARLAPAMMDATTMRLIGWALLSGRLARDDFFPARARGLRQLADAIELYLVHSKQNPVPRDEIEFALLTVIATTFGYSVGKAAFAVALGRTESEIDDDRFRQFLAELVHGALVEKKPTARV